MNRGDLRQAQVLVTEKHYLHRPVDWRTSAEGYVAHVIDDNGWVNQLGVLMFGRPEATRCGDWYGSVDDARAGRCEVTRWQVLNLSRVWLDPIYQSGGELCRAGDVPGYTDRKGVFRSTLASAVLQLAIHRIGFDYLVRRPPCFLDEPYEIKWLLSYCDTRIHRGAIYAAAGFERYRINAQGIETWRIRLPALTAANHARICRIAERNPRSRLYRAERVAMEAQLSLI